MFRCNFKKLLIDTLKNLTILTELKESVIKRWKYAYVQLGSKKNYTCI